MTNPLVPKHVSLNVCNGFTYHLRDGKVIIIDLEHLSKREKLLFINVP